MIQVTHDDRMTGSHDEANHLGATINYKKHFNSILSNPKPTPTLTPTSVSNPEPKPTPKLKPPSLNLV